MITLTVTEDRRDNKLVLVLKEKAKINLAVQGGTVPLAIDSSNNSKLSITSGPSTTTTIPLESTTTELVELENVNVIGESASNSYSGIVLKPLQSVVVKKIVFYSKNSKFEVKSNSDVSVIAKRVNVQENSNSNLVGITIDGKLCLAHNANIKITKVNLEKAQLEVFAGEQQKNPSYISFNEKITQAPLSIMIYSKKTASILQNDQSSVNIISESSDKFSIDVCKKWALKVSSDQNGYGVCETNGNNNIVKAYFLPQQNTGNEGNDGNGGGNGNCSGNDEQNDDDDDGDDTTCSNGNNDKKDQSEAKALGNIQLETVFLGTSPNILVN